LQQYSLFITYDNEKRKEKRKEKKKKKNYHNLISLDRSLSVELTDDIVIFLK